MQVAIDETDRRRAIQDGLQRRARHRADDDRQGHPRPQRAAARRRRVDAVVYASERRRRARPTADRAQGRGARGPDGGRDEGRGQAARVRAGGGPPRRDPADPAARPRAGRVDRSSRGPRSARPARTAAVARRPPARPIGRGAAAATRPRPRRRSIEVTSVEVLPADEEPAANLDGVPGEPGIDENTHRRLAARHPRRARGRPRLAGPLARPPDVGPHASRRTSASGPASGRDGAASSLVGASRRHEVVRPRATNRVRTAAGTGGLG